MPENEKIRIVLPPIELEYHKDSLGHWTLGRDFDPHELEKVLREHVIREIKTRTGVDVRHGGGPLVCLPDYLRDEKEPW